MRDGLELAGVRLAMFLAGALPERAALQCGRALGGAAERLGIRRTVALDNVGRAFGASLDDDARRALVRASYRHLGTSLIEFLRLPHAGLAARRAGLVLDGEEHFRNALAAGRGAIVASGHIGNWEWMGACLTARDFPVTFVVQRMRNARVEAQVERLRGAAGIDVVARGMGLRRVHAALAANRLVFFMCDQDARRRGMFVPFFGIPASTPKGAAQLAVRERVPFVPAFGWRGPQGRHHATVHAPLVPPSGDEDEAVRTLLAGFNRRLEDAIRRAPEQYWWAHRRWKTRPPAQTPTAASRSG